MTQEDKNLLLKDLCARLPYGVKVKLLCRGPEPKFDDWIEVTLSTKDIELFGKSFKNIKPYLRPMPSMSEEEKEVVRSMNMISGAELNDRLNYQRMYVQNYTIETFDYFNERKLDYRGLIPMGLALEAPEGMYKNE